MLLYLTILLSCQLAGELLAAATGLPIPGPVCGMALLFVGLAINKGVPKDLGDLTDGLLTNLSLLFVPAGVGVMLHFQLLATDWLPLSLAILISTSLTVVVTAGIMSYLGKAGGSQKL